mmetsp:Transcript_60158/g.71567  ORF Transcript_60158/g.71567 Transcript_60158/m.71567 type:complete len:115 (+) Transcript_60158:523-867(+)
MTRQLIKLLSLHSRSGLCATALVNLPSSLSSDVILALSYHYAKMAHELLHALLVTLGKVAKPDDTFISSIEQRNVVNFCRMFCRRWKIGISLCTTNGRRPFRGFPQLDDVMGFE